MSFMNSLNKKHKPLRRKFFSAEHVCNKRERESVGAIKPDEVYDICATENWYSTEFDTDTLNTAKFVAFRTSFRFKIKKKNERKDREKKPRIKKTSLLLHQDVMNLFTYDKTYFERIRVCCVAWYSKKHRKNRQPIKFGVHQNWCLFMIIQ